MNAGVSVSAQWPPQKPQLLRDYGRERDFRRHAAQLARTGWQPILVDVQQRTPLFRVLNVLSLGMLALLTGGGPALRVTYSTLR